MTLAILNEGLEFEIWLSEHLIAGTLRVLSTAFSWSKAQTEQYRTFVESMANRAGGIVEPTDRVTDCADWEDNRVLELAETVGAFLIVSSDDDLVQMPPWHGTPMQTPEAFVSGVDAMRRAQQRRT
jgi:predicted nucleic acid-binding protein